MKYIIIVVQSIVYYDPGNKIIEQWFLLQIINIINSS